MCPPPCGPRRSPRRTKKSKIDLSKQTPCFITSNPLHTAETPKQILSEDFPKHNWPISGGWGYTTTDAVVIELDNTEEGVALEYKFLEYRTYEELIIFQPKEERMAGIKLKTELQAVSNLNGHTYDHVVMTVSCYKDSDFEFLKADFESHNWYVDDPDGLQKHNELAESKKLHYKVEAWFNIDQFWGK